MTVIYKCIKILGLTCDLIMGASCMTLHNTDGKISLNGSDY